MDTMTTTKVTRAAVEDFLYEEAARADAADFAGWLELWAEGATYYAPVNDDDADPRRHLALFNETYAQIQTRVRIHLDGQVHAQSPRHRTSRIIGNVRIGEAPGGLVEARAVFNLTAWRFKTFNTFAGRLVYLLRPEGESFRIVRKEIYLINNDGHLPNMTFLL
jgi:3-phenylpropionate/cinnamic acid dioxygenase small subunit